MEWEGTPAWLGGINIYDSLGFRVDPFPRVLWDPQLLSVHLSCDTGDHVMGAPVWCVADMEGCVGVDESKESHSSGPTLHTGCPPLLSQ